jgi:hypothetical protein
MRAARAGGRTRLGNDAVCTSDPQPRSAQQRPSATSTGKARNDLKKGRAIRSLKAGAVKIKVKYSLRDRVQEWSPGVAQPLNVSLTAATKPRMVQGHRVAGQRIYLSRVTAYLEISDAMGHLDSPDPLVDRADVTPGFLVTAPTYYDQVFSLPALPARATKLTIDFRYEILLLQPFSSPRDFERRTATDTLIISRP